MDFKDRWQIIGCIVCLFTVIALSPPDVHVGWDVQIPGSYIYYNLHETIYYGRNHRRSLTHIFKIRVGQTDYWVPGHEGIHVLYITGVYPNLEETYPSNLLTYTQ